MSYSIITSAVDLAQVIHDGKRVRIDEEAATWEGIHSCGNLSDLLQASHIDNVISRISIKPRNAFLRAVFSTCRDSLGFSCSFVEKQKFYYIQQFSRALSKMPLKVYEKDVPIGFTQPDNFPFSNVNAAVSIVKETLRSFQSKDLQGPAQELACTLDRRIFSFQYLGSNQITLQGSLLEASTKVDCLFQMSEKWLAETKDRREDYLYMHATLDPLKEILSYLCKKFPEFSEECVRNTVLRNKFFKFILQTSLDSTQFVDIFVLTPEIADDLVMNCIVARIRNRDEFRIREIYKRSIIFQDTERSGKRIVNVSLLFAHGNEYRSIIDPEYQIELGKSVSRSVREIFATFNKWKKTYIDMEIIEDGFAFFDSRLPKEQSKELDDRLDDRHSNKDEWYKFLPNIEVRTTQEIEAILGKTITNEEGFLVLKSTRTFPGLQPRGSHVYFDLYMRREGGFWKGFSFGCYAVTTPRTTMETLSHMFQTHPAHIIFIDSNRFIYEREHKIKIFPALDKKLLSKLLDVLRKDIQKSREGSLTFQAQGNNCTDWVVSLLQRLYEDIIPPKDFDCLFMTEYREVTGAGPFSLAVKAPLSIRKSLMVALGGSKKYWYKDEQGVWHANSLTQTRAFLEGKSRLPSKLWYQDDEVDSLIKKISLFSETHIHQ